MHVLDARDEGGAAGSIGTEAAVLVDRMLLDLLEEPELAVRRLGADRDLGMHTFGRVSLGGTVGLRKGRWSFEAILLLIEIC